MNRLRVAPIVEGHGEVNAVRLLLERVWRDLLGGEFMEVLQPIRQPRTKLLKPNTRQAGSMPDPHELDRAVRLAKSKLAQKQTPDTRALILVLLDANSDCPKDLGPSLLEASREAARPQDIAVVLAKVEYETWFAACASSLGEHLHLHHHDIDIHDAEQRKLGKKWIQDRFRGRRYSETVDQVKLTARMDLKMCRKNSPSFDKLCRELERFVESRVN